MNKYLQWDGPEASPQTLFSFFIKDYLFHQNNNPLCTSLTRWDKLIGDKIEIRALELQTASTTIMENKNNWNVCIKSRWNKKQDKQEFLELPAWRPKRGHSTKNINKKSFIPNPEPDSHWKPVRYRRLYGACSDIYHFIVLLWFNNVLLPTCL